MLKRKEQLRRWSWIWNVVVASLKGKEKNQRWLQKLCPGKPDGGEAHFLGWGAEAKEGRAQPVSASGLCAQVSVHRCVGVVVVQ